MSSSASVVSPSCNPFENFEPADGVRIMTTSRRPPSGRPAPSTADTTEQRRQSYSSSVFDTPPRESSTTTPAVEPGLRERRLSRPGIGIGTDMAVPLQLVIEPQSQPAPEVTPNAVSTNDEEAELEAVKMEAKVIFENFIQQEVVAEGLPPPANFSPTSTAGTQTTASLNESISNGVADVRESTGVREQQDRWFEHGLRLKMIAEDFKKSKERKEVARQADSVDLTSINRNSFMSLLNGLFPQSNITLEGIVTLFVFCRDLAVRLLAENLPDSFCNMINWAVTFISQNVCRWVFAHGGWGVILSATLSSAWYYGNEIKSILAVAFIASIAFYFMRRGIR